MRSATRKHTGKDPAYRAFIAAQPCFICRLFKQYQQTRTEIAHVGERGLSQKCPDRETLPACAWHHRLGPESLHRLGVKFWQRWGLDKAKLLAEYQYRFQVWDAGIPTPWVR